MTHADALKHLCDEIGLLEERQAELLHTKKHIIKLLLNQQMPVGQIARMAGLTRGRIYQIAKEMQ